MPPIPADPKAQEYLAKLGEFVVQWNHVEAITQMMLRNLAGSGFKADILIANLGNVAPREAIVTLANEFSEPLIRDHIIHYCKFFDHVREHRNWIVSWRSCASTVGRSRVGRYPECLSVGVRLVSHQSFTGADEIVARTQDTVTLQQYGTQLLAELGAFDKDPPGFQPLSSLEKPPLPERLQKPRLFLLDALHQRQPLQG